MGVFSIMNLFLDFYRVCGATLGTIFALGLSAWTLRHYTRPPRRLDLASRSPRLVIVRSHPLPPTAGRAKVGRRAA